MNLWLLIIICGLLTVAIRLSFILLLGRVAVGGPLQRALRFVPPAVLAAIIVPEVLLQQGALNVSLGNARLLAALAATAVAWRTKNVLATIVVGMAVLWIAQAALGFQG